MLKTATLVLGLEMTNWSVRRIKALSSLNDAQRYLEIGVNAGETFLNVDIPFKDGVDPQFLFNVNPHATDRIRFFSKPSDRFWTSRDPRIYDVIFIDGLHTFEQTIRDLISSMRFAHSRTVWLIDDTLPSDVISAIPNQRRSLRERRRLKLPGLPWHGDVFKIVPAIHDFFPTFRYATITGSGNPQTLAWYSPRTDFAARFESWEAISRMTFFDMEENISVFNVVDEQTALEQIRKDFLVT